MPRYYFHIHDHIETRDDEGTELPDLASAREAAIRAARGMMADQVLAGHLNLDHRVEVEDENGRSVLAVRFRDAIEIAP